MVKGLKKFIAIALIAVMMFAVFTGCGSNQAGSSSAGSDSSAAADKSAGSDNSASGEAATITYAIWDKNQEPGMKAIADAFMKKNTNIKVNVEVTPWDQYWTKLEAAATGGALPDVFWMHVNNFLKYQSNGMLMDITANIKGSQNVDMNNFPEGLVSLYSADGKNYAIPKDYDTIALWYNKTMFDEAKIPYPDDTWDWNKLLEVAQKLTDTSKGIYGFLAPEDNQSGFWNFIYQNGGYVISPDKKSSGYDKPETQEAMQFWADFSLKHKVSPTVQQFADTSYVQYFESGKAAMALFGSWMVSEFKANDYVKQNADLAVIPKGKNKATIYNGLGNSISAKTKYPDACWKLVEFMGTEEANKLQAQYGSAIPAYKGTEQGWIDFSPEFNLKVYPEMISYGVIYQNSKTASKWIPSEVTNMTNVLSGKVSVQEGCNQLAKEMNDFLATE